MFYKSLLFFCVPYFCAGCTGSIAQKFDYPNTDDVELHIKSTNIRLVVSGKKLFRNQEATLFVTILDKNFGTKGDAEFDCFMVDNGKRLYAESLDELTPGYYEIVFKPTWSGRAKIILRVRCKEFEEAIKLNIVINE